MIDLDLRSFFDTVRHDLMLAKIARRVQDDDLLWLCKRILKASDFGTWCDFGTW